MPFYMMKITDPFYKSTRWERKRAHILRRDGYMCQESKRYGKRVQANTVHHILPRDRFPQYAWEDWNLISLSAEQHNRMHYRDTDDLTAAGLDLARRTLRRRGLDESCLSM